MEKKIISYFLHVHFEFFFVLQQQGIPMVAPWKAEVSPVTFNHNIKSTLAILFLTQKIYLQ